MRIYHTVRTVNRVCTSFLSICATCPPVSLFSIWSPNKNWWRLQIIKILIMQFSPLSCYLVPLRPKYLTQHPILKHPQSTFLFQHERTYFTTIQETGNIVIFYVLNLYCWIPKCTTKILHRMIASISLLQSALNFWTLQWLRRFYCTCANSYMFLNKAIQLCWMYYSCNYI